MNGIMKTKLWINLLIIGLTSASCEGPMGPQGPQGEKGAANVIYSEWLDIEWNGANEPDYKRMDIIEPVITEEFMSKGTVLMYLQVVRSESDRLVHALPFTTSTNLTFGFFMRPEGFTSSLPGTFPHDAGLSFYIQYGGSGLASYSSYTQVRYILIPDGKPAKVSSGFWNDYEAVTKYFHISG